MDLWLVGTIIIVVVALWVVAEIRAWFLQMKLSWLQQTMSGSGSQSSEGWGCLAVLVVVLLVALLWLFLSGQPVNAIWLR